MAELLLKLQTVYLDPIKDLGRKSMMIVVLKRLLELAEQEPDGEQKAA